MRRRFERYCLFLLNPSRLNDNNDSHNDCDTPGADDEALAADGAEDLETSMMVAEDCLTAGVLLPVEVPGCG